MPTASIEFILSHVWHQVRIIQIVQIDIKLPAKYNFTSTIVEIDEI